jgi:hypothetical protein
MRAVRLDDELQRQLDGAPEPDSARRPALESLDDDGPGPGPSAA